MIRDRAPQWFSGIAAVAIIFSLVIVLIVDLDRPGEGWINVRQDHMIDLRNALAVPSVVPSTN